MNNQLKEIIFPTKCPSCGTKLVERDTDSDVVQKFCDNSSCPGKAAEHFYYIANRETLEIDCLGSEMAVELVARKDASNIAELFELSNRVVLQWAQFHSDSKIAEELKDSGFRSGVNALKMFKSVQNAKTATWDRWIACLNIPMIGHSLGRDISKAIGLTTESMKDLPKLFLRSSIESLDKIGIAKFNAIVEWASQKENVDLCKRLYDAGVRPTPLVAKVAVSGAKLSGIKFCITGELSLGSRKEVEKKLEALGAVALSDVKKDCNLVIVGDSPGSKLQKAKDKGIKIVDDTWVVKTLS